MCAGFQMGNASEVVRKKTYSTMATSEALGESRRVRRSSALNLFMVAILWDVILGVVRVSSVSGEKSTLLIEVCGVIGTSV